MNFFGLIIAGSLIFLAFYMSLRKGPLTPFPDVAILYLAFLEFVLFCQATRIIDYQYLREYSSYQFEKKFVEISACVAIYAMLLYVSKAPNGTKVEYGKIFSGIYLPSGAIFVLASLFYIDLFLYAINITARAGHLPAIARTWLRLRPAANREW